MKKAQKITFLMECKKNLLLILGNAIDYPPNKIIKLFQSYPQSKSSYLRLLSWQVPCVSKIRYKNGCVLIKIFIYS